MSALPSGSRRKKAPPTVPEICIDPAATERRLAGFIRNEVGRTGRSRVIVGLSGGIDSAVAAYLAVAALGRSGVIGVLLPYRSSHPDSTRHAEDVVANLGVQADRIDITPTVDAFRGVLGDVGPLRLGNIMARCRMTLLYDLSEEHKALVLGTSNKTEMLLGYGTLHGDLASALNPLGDLYKTQVRALAIHLGVPAAIRRKPPSADLWPDQSDEGELGFSYESVDRLLAVLVNRRASRKAAIAIGFDAAFVDRVTGLILRSQFKRRLPMVARLSSRGPGGASRYPKDWKS